MNNLQVNEINEALSMAEDAISKSSRYSPKELPDGVTCTYEYDPDNELHHVHVVIDKSLVLAGLAKNSEEK